MITDRTYMLLPSAVTLTSSSAQAVAPVTNLLTDEPAMVWRSTSTTATITFTTIAAIDTIALIGCNLRSTDTVRVRAGTTSAVTGYDSTALPAWSGAKADWLTAKSILRLSAPLTYTYWQIDIAAPSHPAGYVEVQRLAVGTALTHIGVEANCELQFLDQSTITQGAAWQSYEKYPVVPAWKVSFPMITDTTFMTTWFNFLGLAGQTRGILFVPDAQTPGYLQNMAVFGTFSSSNTGKHPLHDIWSLEMSIRAKAP
jgi:hypothetical protein